MSIDKKYYKAIILSLLIIYLIAFVLKYTFVDPKDAFSLTFRESKFFIWWVILSEFIIISILYNYSKKERVKDLLIVSLISVIIITLALNHGPLTLPGTPPSDYRLFMAQSQKILVGHLPWEDPYYQGELVTYPYLYFTIVAMIYFAISLIYPISLGKLYILMGIGITAIFPFVMYWCGKKLFNRWVGLLASFFVLPFLSSLGFLGGPHFPSVILVILALTWFHEKKYVRSGIILGLIVYTYYLHVIVTSLTMILFRLFIFLKVEEEQASKNLRVLARTFLTAELVSFPFTLPLIIKYLPNFIPPLILFTLFLLFLSKELKINIKLSKKIILALGTAILIIAFLYIPSLIESFPRRIGFNFSPASRFTTEYFFSHYTPDNLFFAMKRNSIYFKVLVLGLIITFFRQKKNHMLLFSWFIASFIVIHLVALTFFKIGFPQFMRDRIFVPVYILILSMAVYEIFSYSHKIFSMKIEIKKILNFGVIALLILWAPYAIQSVINVEAYYWKFSKNPDPLDIVEHINWIKDNTDPGDVILISPQYAYTWIVPFTGRKVILGRSGDNQLVDYPTRALDYRSIWGTNYTLSKNLLEKYNVKYGIRRNTRIHDENASRELILYRKAKKEDVPWKDIVALFRHKEFKLKKEFRAGNIYEFIPNNEVNPPQNSTG